MLLCEEELPVPQMEIADPEADISRDGRRYWTSACKEPVGKQQSLGQCQLRESSLIQTIQKYCLGIFRLCFLVSGKIQQPIGPEPFACCWKSSRPAARLAAVQVQVLAIEASCGVVRYLRFTLATLGNTFVIFAIILKRLQASVPIFESAQTLLGLRKCGTVGCRCWGLDSTWGTSSRHLHWSKACVHTAFCKEITPWLQDCCISILPYRSRVLGRPTLPSSLQWDSTSMSLKQPRFFFFSREI